MYKERDIAHCQSIKILHDAYNLSLADGTVRTFHGDNYHCFLGSKFFQVDIITLNICNNFRESPKKDTE